MNSSKLIHITLYQKGTKNRTPSFGVGRDSAEVITDLIITTKLKKVLEKLKTEGIFSRVAEKKTRPELKKELIKYFINPGTNNRIFVERKRKFNTQKIGRKTAC